MLEGNFKGRTNGVVADVNVAAVAADAAVGEYARRAEIVVAAGAKPPPAVIIIVCKCTIFRSISCRLGTARIVIGEQALSLINAEQKNAILRIWPRIVDDAGLQDALALLLVKRLIIELRI